jgi:DDE superfamily endonuclease
MIFYRESAIDKALQAPLLVDGVQYYLYGDPVYCLRPYLQVGFQGSERTPENVLFNASMARVRIAVEWAFRDVKLYFTHLAVPRKLRLRVTPAGFMVHMLRAAVEF